jgi:tetratricopeptide (TPR) repeat protein
LRLALSLIPALGEGSDRNELELALLVRLNRALKLTQGMATQEVRSLQERMHNLARGVEEHPDLAEVLYEIWVYHLSHMEFEESRAIAMEWLNRFQEPRTRLIAARCASHSLYFLGRLAESLYYAEMALAIAPLQGEVTHSEAASSLTLAAHHSALLLLTMGLEEEASKRYGFAMERTEKLQDPLGRALSLGEALKFLRRRQDVRAALETAEELQCLFVDLDSHAYMFLAIHTKNWALMKTGRLTEAAQGAESTLELCEKYFLRLGQIGTYAAISLIYTRAGRLEEAESLLERGLAVMAEGGVLHEAELYCARGELYLARANRDSSSTDLDLAEKALRKAFALARQRYQVLIAQEAVSLLVPLLESQGWPLEAVEVEIEMHRLREEAATRAEKILAETGALLLSAKAAATVLT